MRRTGVSGELVFVRPACLVDLPEITAIAYSSATDMTPGSKYEAHTAANQERLGSKRQYELRRDVIQRSIDSPRLQRVVVATLGDVAVMAETPQPVIGYMLARRAEPEDYFAREHVLIHGTAVSKDNRERDAGTKLLSAVCGWSEDMGLPVCAQVADTNRPMLGMLEKSGFVQQGTYGPTEANPVTFQVMVRMGEAVVPV